MRTALYLIGILLAVGISIYAGLVLTFFLDIRRSHHRNYGIPGRHAGAD